MITLFLHWTDVHLKRKTTEKKCVSLFSIRMFLYKIYLCCSSIYFWLATRSFCSSFIDLSLNIQWFFDYLFRSLHSKCTSHIKQSAHNNFLPFYSLFHFAALHLRLICTQIHSCTLIREHHKKIYRRCADINYAI